MPSRPRATPATYWHSYTHDAAGNRTSETLRTPGAAAVTRSYTYPAAGDPQPHALQQVTSTGASGAMSFTYDQAGNTTSRTVDGQLQELTWNAEGRITRVEDGGDSIRMVYDADGNRLIRDDGDTVTAYLPHTELTWDRATNTVDGTRYFTHAGQVVAVCVGQDPADWTWMGVDHHGSTTTHSVNALTAVEQVRRMDPYGNPRGTAPQTWPGQQGFVGGIHDPTGLIHVGARSYDPTTGRFLSIDPILNISDSQQINGYSYANNNPITLSDPTGLMAVWNIVGTSGGGTAHRSSLEEREPSWYEKLGLAAVGAVAGYDNWAADKFNSIVEFVDDPVGTLKQTGGEYYKWTTKAINKGLPSSTGGYCVATGLCDAYEEWRNGNYYEAGYRVGQLAADIVVTVGGGVAAGAALKAAKIVLSAIRPALPRVPGASPISQVTSPPRTFPHFCGCGGGEVPYFSAYPREFLDQAARYGMGGVRELPDGRVRFYGEIVEARTPGEMFGRRLVREWDPRTGATRIWHETVDHLGNIRIVRPDVDVTGGKKVHYMFDVYGNYTGSW